jgi:polyhydroxyalkanoate synthesis regulator phasin
LQELYDNFLLLQELHEYLNTSHKQYIADSQATVNQLHKKLQDLQRELDSSVPFTAIHGTKMQLENALQSLAKERTKVDELERMVSMLKNHAGGLTPRPNWSYFRLHGIEVQ